MLFPCFFNPLSCLSLSCASRTKKAHLKKKKRNETSLDSPLGLLTEGKDIEDQMKTVQHRDESRLKRLVSHLANECVSIRVVDKHSSSQPIIIGPVGAYRLCTANARVLERKPSKSYDCQLLCEIGGNRRKRQIVRDGGGRTRIMTYRWP